MKWRFGAPSVVLLLIITLISSAVSVYGQQTITPIAQSPKISVETPRSYVWGYTATDLVTDPQPQNSLQAQASALNQTLTTVSNTIQGIGFDDSFATTGAFFIPADPSGAAGPDRLVAVVNAMIEARDKTGTSLWRDSLRNLFLPLGAGTLGTFTFDSKVIYDEHAGRFVVVALEKDDATQNARILLAVSHNSSPATAGATDWYLTAIDSTIVLEDGNYWAEYSGLEVDEAAIYLTADTFSFNTSAYGGSRLWIIDKGVSGGLYAGGTVSAAVYDPYASCGETGCITSTTLPAQIHGVSGVGPVVGTFLVSYNGFSFENNEYLQVIHIDNPLATPTFVHQLLFVGNIDDTLTQMADAPQNGTSTLVETNDRRVLDAVWRNNALWVVATVLPTSGADAGQATAHWWKLDTSGISIGSSITLSDQGHIGGEDIAPGTFTYFPAVAVNVSGDVCFGFSASSPTTYVGAYAAARATADAAGTVQSSAVVHAGIDYYVRTFGGSGNRWGDQSGISVDPADNTTFWVFNQFADTRGSVIFSEDGRWRTAWGTCATDQPQFASGDINADASVNVLDLQIMINMILHQPQPDTALYAADWWQRADLVSDSQWNVLDLQTLINLIQSSGP